MLKLLLSTCQRCCQPVKLSTCQLLSSCTFNSFFPFALGRPSISLLSLQECRPSLKVNNSNNNMIFQIFKFSNDRLFLACFQACLPSLRASSTLATAINQQRQMSIREATINNQQSTTNNQHQRRGCKSIDQSKTPKKKKQNFGSFFPNTSSDVLDCDWFKAPVVRAHPKW